MKRFRRYLSFRDNAIEAKAAAWLAERDDGLTPEAAAEFARWRRADPRHEAAVALLESTWGALQQLRACPPEAQRQPAENLHPGPVTWSPALFPLLAAAAALAVLVALVAQRGRWQPDSAPAAVNESVSAVYATSATGYSRIALPDGSVLKLNAGSEVHLHFTPAGRQIRLVRGEANFVVAEHKTRPFLVTAGTVFVRDVGTEFDVSLRPGSVEVLVTKGRVLVGRGSAPAAGGRAAAPQTLAELGAGQRADISLLAAAAPPLVAAVSPAAVHQALAWQQPRLEFVDTPLAQVVKQFNQFNRVQLELGDPALGAQTVSGSFQAENVDAFVRLLASGREIAVERPDPNHIVLRLAK